MGAKNSEANSGLPLICPTRASTLRLSSAAAAVGDGDADGAGVASGASVGAAFVTAAVVGGAGPAAEGEGGDEDGGAPTTTCTAAEAEASASNCCRGSGGADAAFAAEVCWARVAAGASAARKALGVRTCSVDEVGVVEQAVCAAISSPAASSEAQELWPGLRRMFHMAAFLGREAACCMLAGRTAYTLLRTASLGRSARLSVEHCR
ncbi:MAG: hypothetical protein D6824_06045 [Planctomycetota bacterium]|nr:MAG: hypothetical protein D6824_06045 [Planctomycetota bacterium]